MRTEANLKKAAPLDRVSYTHSAAVAAGEVIIPSSTMLLILIAATAMAASVEGTYYVLGEFELTIATGITVAQYDKLYFVVADNKVSNVYVDDATTPYIGYATEAGTAEAGYVRVSINDKPGSRAQSPVKVILDGATLKALLDTNENNLIPVKVGDKILSVSLTVGTAAGAACAVTIGTDVVVDGTTADPDSLLKAGDANAAGHQASKDPANTYIGADLVTGSFTAVGSGNLTITASSDQSASAFVGSAIVEYLPA